MNTRHDSLRAAQAKADLLFKEIESRMLVRPGVSEKELNQEIYQLALEMYGIKKYWHKRIVRSGENTLCPYEENPPDRFSLMISCSLIWALYLKIGRPILDVPMY